MKKADLHLHSSVSYDVDNKTLTPEFLFGYAMGIGMDYFTLTDHDTMDGIKELYDIYGDDDPRIISGIEFTVENMALPPDFIGKDRVSFRTHLNILNLTFEDFEVFKELEQSFYAYHKYCEYIYEKEDRLIYVQYNHPFWYFRRDRLPSNVKYSRMLIQESKVNEINQDVPHSDNVLISSLSRRHDKGISGGSDSHTGKVGWFHTLAPGDTKEAFIQNIIDGNAQIGQIDLETKDHSQLNLNESFLRRVLNGFNNG